MLSLYDKIPKHTENMQTTSTKQEWLDKGYEHFALYGPENLSINKISKEVGFSRASFYHHFGNIENGNF